MRVRSRLSRLGVPLAILAGSCLAAACGGGGGTRSIPQASPSPVASGATQAAVPASGGSVALPAAGGVTPTLVFGSGVPAGTTIEATTSTTAPANAPAPSSERRSIKAISGAVPIEYLVFTVSQSFSASLLTSIQLALSPSDPATAAYYVEFDDLTSGAKLGTNGPASDVSGTVTFATGAGFATGGLAAPTLSTTDTYLAQFYYVPAAAASPSPGVSASPSALPSSSPSPAASPSPSASPSAVPSPSPSPSVAPSPSASPSVAPSPSPSSSPTSGNSPLPDYGFTGPSTSTGMFFPPQQAPATLYLPAAGSGPYGAYGVTASVQFDYAGGYASNPASTTSNITMTLGDSIDITSHAFPYYTGTNHPVFYAQFKNTGTAHFVQFPNVIVTAANMLPSMACSFYVYASNGGLAPTWNAVVGPVTATATSNGSGGTMSVINFPPQVLSSGTVDITNAGPSYVMVGC